MLATAVNLFLDYGMIFGNFGFRKWDAAIASVYGVSSFVIYVVLMGPS